MNQNTIIWFRRDLRLYDNAALFHALKDSNQVFPVFIFDIQILSKLQNKKDRRIEFILQSLAEIKKTLNENGSDLIVEMGDPEFLIPKLITEYKCNSLYINRDYEKYAQDRDQIISKILLNKELSQMSSTSLGLLKQRIKFFFNIKLSKFSFRKTIVKTIKIDQLKLNPNIIKIDTEGSELEVLKSAKKTIKIYKPIIIVEYNHNNFIKIDKLMKNFDYNSYQYSKNKLEVLNLKKKLLLKKQKNAENIVYLSNNKNNKQLKKIQKLISK